MLKVKLQYFGQLVWRVDSLEKTLILGKIEGKMRSGNRGWDGWLSSLMHWTWVWANSRRQWRTQKPGVLQSMGSQRVEHDLGTEQQQLTSKEVWPQAITQFLTFPDTSLSKVFFRVLLACSDFPWGMRSPGWMKVVFNSQILRNLLGELCYKWQSIVTLEVRRQSTSRNNFL